MWLKRADHLVFVIMVLNDTHVWVSAEGAMNELQVQSKISYFV